MSSISYIITSVTQFSGLRFSLPISYFVSNILLHFNPETVKVYDTVYSNCGRQLF